MHWKTTPLAPSTTAEPGMKVGPQTSQAGQASTKGCWTMHPSGNLKRKHVWKQWKPHHLKIFQGSNRPNDHGNHRSSVPSPAIPIHISINHFSPHEPNHLKMQACNASSFLTKQIKIRKPCWETRSRLILHIDILHVKEEHIRKQTQIRWQIQSIVADHYMAEPNGLTHRRGNNMRNWKRHEHHIGIWLGCCWDIIGMHHVEFGFSGSEYTQTLWQIADDT